MAEPRICPKCGMPFPPDTAPNAPCPRCLLDAGLEADATEATTEAEETSPSMPPAPKEGFGPYEPMGILGEGGMGVVYLARQHSPIRRRVALKVLKRTMHGRDFQTRFEQERQALALMDHPNVAKVLDAGTTEAGQPYFAMEYVPGIPITDYCDRNHLGYRERLALFQQVCHAVHHAHQKGVIHRDLKPSNILVALQDGNPVPKVIDFGVSKAVNQRLAERTLFTEMGVLIGTPEYMSPEQADPTGLDVDTTTDVYSLGILLYELLVGTVPFESKMLRRAGFDEVRRIIREEEPPTPSARLHSLGNMAAEIARNRRADVSSLVRQLRGDLEWITMRAIDKDRTRRYASASEFAADIQRHLDDEPVVASPPNASYRMRKFVRRHRPKVIAGGLVAASIIAGLAVSLVLYARAERQREIAEWQGYKAQLAAARSEVAAFRSEAAKRLLFESPPRLRGWEWRYLYAMADSSLMTLQSRGDHTYTNRLAFTQDSSRMFLTRRNTYHEWDLGLRREVAVYGPFGPIIAMLPSGERILARARSGNEHDLELIEPRSGAALRLSGHKSLVTSAAFTSDGARVVTGSIDGVIRVWNTATGETLLTIPGTARTERRQDFPVDDLLAVSPDGSRIAYSLGWSIGLWDGRTGRRIATLPHSKGSLIQSIVFGARGDRIYSACEAIRVWDAGTGKQVGEYVVTAITPTRLAAPNPDGRSVAAVTWNRELHIWPSAEDTGITIPLAGLGTSPAALSFTPNGRYLAVADDSGQVKIWDAATFGGRLLRQVDSGPVALAFNPDQSQAITLTFEGGIELWATESGRLIQSWTGQSWQRGGGYRNAVALSARGVAATVDQTNVVRIWRAGLSQPVFEFTGPAARVSAVEFRPDGEHLVSGSVDGTLLVWDISTGREISRLTTGGAIRDVHYTRDGRFLAVASERHLQFLDPVSGAVVRQFPQAGRPGDFLSRIAFSRDGRRILGMKFMGSGVVWEADTGRVLGVLDSSTRRIAMGAAFSSDGTRIITAQADQTMTIWDAARHEALLTLPLHPAMDLAVSNNGRRIYAADTGSVLTYKTDSGYSAEAEELVARLSRQSELVSDVRMRIEADPSLRPDAKRVALDFVERQYTEATSVWPALDEVLTSPRRPSSELSLALRRAEVMYRWFPNDTRARLYLGLAYFRNDAPEQAIRVLDPPDFRRPPNRAPGVDAAVLAMSYHKLNETDKANRHLEMARADLKQLRDRRKSMNSSAPGSVRNRLLQEEARLQKLLNESEDLLRRRD